MRTARSFCRICSAHCGTVLMIDDDERIVSIRGDKDQPLSRGYACFKGLQAEEAHHGPARLLRPLKRMPDGRHIEIGLEQALDEIAERVATIRDYHGKDAIGLFNGNGGTPNSTGYPMTHAFLAAIGTRSLYSTLSIDQSAKVVAVERLGAWIAGLQDMSQSDVLLFVGTNPLVSHSTVPVMGPDPVKRMKDAKTRGMRLIVIDPRRTETAHFADLFIQPKPGEDPAILAGLLNIILREGWEDAAFCAEHVGTERMAALRTAVAPYTPDRVGRRAGIAAEELEAAARIFAHDNRRGAAYAATGPCMAPFSNLTQHLVEVLNVVCGRMRRAGDPLVVDLTSPEGPIPAQVYPPTRSWSQVPDSRIRGVGRLGGERLTGTLAEEILTPGEGQVRALFVNGGNPAATVPDQRRMVAALEALDLLVVVDPYMTITARLADYVLPPRMQYERADLPLSIPNYPLQPENWLQFTPAVIGPPMGSDLTEDWYVYWSIARRLGCPITFAGEVLDMATPPTTEDLIALRLKDARVPFETLRALPSGGIFENDAWRVAPSAGGGALFDVMPIDVLGELEEFERAQVDEGRFPFRLTSRRLRDNFNSNGPQLSGVRKRNPYNALHVHPDDLAELGVAEGDAVMVASEHGTITARVQPDGGMRRKVVSMTHGWGGLPGDPARDGDNVNLLIDSSRHIERINAMPRMSAIPVSLAAAAVGERERTVAALVA